MEQGEDKPLKEFVKRYHRPVLDLGAFNHPQALRELKVGVRIGRLWYNMRYSVIQSYYITYERRKETLRSTRKNQLGSEASSWRSLDKKRNEVRRV